MSKYRVCTLDGDTLGSGSLAEHVDLLLGSNAPREVVVIVDLGIPFKAEVVKPAGEPEHLTVQMASFERTFVKGQEPHNVLSRTPGTSFPGTVVGILVYFEERRFITLYPKGDATLMFSPRTVRNEGVSITEFILKAETAVHDALYGEFENR